MLKKFIWFLIIIFCGNISLISQINYVDSLLHQAVWRTYKVHLPPSYDGSTSYPLVIALHGGGHDADTMEYISNLSIKADSANFIVVYPNGRKFFVRTWNAGTCCGGAVTNNVDDVGFIVKMINSLKANLNIDTNRIYLTGASNGGMLAYRLACEKSEIFAAVAPVATTMVVTNFCLPGRRVPILHIHSMPDLNVPYYGGYGIGFAGVYMPPVDSVLNVWANNDSCAGTIDTVFNSFGVIGKRWNNCASCSEVLVYTTTDGGHSWPGGNQTANGDPPSTLLNATDLIWNFFSNHTLNCSPSNIEESQSQCNLNSFVKVYPNPTKDFVNIYTSSSKDFEIKIFDILGQQIKSVKNINKINLTNLKNGVYVFVINQHGIQHALKILLTK